MCLSQQLTHPPHPSRRWASNSDHLAHCHLQEKCFVFHSSTFHINNSGGNKTGCVSPYHVECPAKVSPCHPTTFLFSMSACHSASVTVRMLNVWRSISVSACQRVNVVGVVLYECMKVVMCEGCNV